MSYHSLSHRAAAVAAAAVLAAASAAVATGAAQASPVMPAESALSNVLSSGTDRSSHAVSAASQLARDYRVSEAEATRRISRQESQLRLAGDLREKFSKRFGGAWIDQKNQGKLIVALTGSSSGERTVTANKVAAAATASGLADTTTVTVPRAESELEDIQEEIARRISAANKGARNGLQSFVDIKANSVQIDLPEGKKLTPAQQAVVQWATKRYTKAVRLGTYKHPSVPLYCGDQYACDPPLRSGVAVYMGGGRCTSAFMTYSGSSYYMLTAGHCAEMGYSFYVPTYSYGNQYVGSAAGYDFGYYGDSAVVRIEDSGWWQPRGWVFPQTSIRSYGTDYVGQYVCKEGSTTGYTCGEVTQTNATVYYPGRTLTGMTWSTACVAAGDSGSGVYYGSLAYGILSGGPNSGCGMIHEPVKRALRRWGVNILPG